MDIRPSGEVLKALGALHTDRVAAKPRAAEPQGPDAARLKRAEMPAKSESPQPSRSYRPGSFLDIYV